MLATAVEFDWDILQLDVPVAFLNANVDEEVYFNMAPGYKKKGKKAGVPVVRRLRKSLYGLRQSPKNWHSTIDTFVKIGFKSLTSEPSVYVYYTDDDSINNSTANTSRKPEAILTIYDDDLMLAGGDEVVLKMLKEKLISHFATTDMGDISLIRGMQVTLNRENGTLAISQTTQGPCSKSTEWGSEKP